MKALDCHGSTWYALPCINLNKGTSVIFFFSKSITKQKQRKKNQQEFLVYIERLPPCVLKEHLSELLWTPRDHGHQEGEGWTPVPTDGERTVTYESWRSPDRGIGDQNRNTAKTCWVLDIAKDKYTQLPTKCCTRDNGTITEKTLEVTATAKLPVAGSLPPPYLRVSIFLLLSGNHTRIGPSIF